jgi:hypothetical protein
MRPTIHVFDVADTPVIIETFLPFSAEMRGGVSVDLGDINGDGVPDLVTGTGYRGQSAVEVLDGNSGELLTEFTGYIDSNAPVRVARDGGLMDRIITAQGPNGKTNQIRSFDLVFGDDGELIAEFDPLATLDLNELDDPRLLGAYFVALLDFNESPAPMGEESPPTGDEGTNGSGDSSEENEAGGVLSFPGEPEATGRLPGDANGDGVFNSSDLVKVFAAGEYADEIPLNSSFETGDWNLDGEFDSRDLVFVFQAAIYEVAAQNSRMATNLGTTNSAIPSKASVDLVTRDRLFELNDQW